jgi:hypothetical protein
VVSDLYGTHLYLSSWVCINHKQLSSNMNTTDFIRF